MSKLYKEHYFVWIFSFLCLFYAYVLGNAHFIRLSFQWCECLINWIRFFLHWIRMCDCTFQNESQSYFLSLSDSYITVESTQLSLKWCKNYQHQFTGLVILTIWSQNHHRISFWEISKESFHQSAQQQVGAGLKHDLVTFINTFCTFINIVQYKKDRAMWFCWKPRI